MKLLAKFGNVINNSIPMLSMRQTAVREVEDSSPRPDQFSGHKITEENVRLCNYICKWLDVQVFSEMDYKP